VGLKKIKKALLGDNSGIILDDMDTNLTPAHLGMLCGVSPHSKHKHILFVSLRAGIHMLQKIPQIIFPSNLHCPFDWSAVLLLPE
jgi:hypothetical protein